MPPNSSAPSTQMVLPKWMDTAPPPGSGSLICKNVKITYASAASNPTSATRWTCLFCFIS